MVVPCNNKGVNLRFLVENSKKIPKKFQIVYHPLNHFCPVFKTTSFHQFCSPTTLPVHQSGSPESLCSPIGGSKLENNGRLPLKLLSVVSNLNLIPSKFRSISIDHVTPSYHSTDDITEGRKFKVPGELTKHAPFN